MKTTKRLLALLLAVLALFSVLTVFASAEDVEEPTTVVAEEEEKPTFSIPLKDFFKYGGSINFYSRIAERTVLIADWVKGVCSFVVALALQPVKVVLSQFGIVTVA